MNEKQCNKLFIYALGVMAIIGGLLYIWSIVEYDSRVRTKCKIIASEYKPSKQAQEYIACLDAKFKL